MKQTFTRKIKKMKIHKENEVSQELVITKQSAEEAEELEENVNGKKHIPNTSV